MDLFEQLFLRRGQIDAGAVPAGESSGIHFHFFAFDTSRKAENHHDKVSGARRLDCPLGFFIGKAPDQAGFGAAHVLEVFDFDGIRMVFFEADNPCGRRCWVMYVPIFGNEIAIKPQPPAVLASEANEIVTRFRRHEEAGPANRVVV